MISIRQVKAARALLGWSQDDLARESGVSYPTIARVEAQDGTLGGRASTSEAILKALARAGVEFTNGGEPGVKLRALRTVDEQITRQKGKIAANPIPKEASPAKGVAMLRRGRAEVKLRALKGKKGGRTKPEGER